VSGPVWAIVVAAGSGSRFGGPKQYEVLAGRRVLDWSLDAARQACDGVVLVVPPDRAGEPEPVDFVVAGGATRSGSVRNGLARIPAGAEVIAVHDAARPLATSPLFDAAVAAVRAGAAGAICAVPLTDTVKRVDGAEVAETLDRRQLVAVQTPQAFDAAALRQAHAGEPEATDDAAVVEAAGGRVVVVPGDPYNIKITSRADLAVAEALLAMRSTA
jgi:2-C-methyl-D-erythritol 4-phosphate cytidylyltransferase